MNCWSARRQTAGFVDDRLRAGERARLAKHLAECHSCAAEVDQLRTMRSTLSRLPQMKAPAELRTALRVSASQEKQALVMHEGSRLQRLWNYWLYRLDELMRPITLPATGGLLSSIMLFGALSLTIGETTRIANYEVPVMYADRMDANLVPVQLRSSVVLTLNLDGKGRITDYAVQDGAMSFVGDPSRLQYNNIAVPDFPSVLALAQPVSRGISISVTPIFFRQ
jgi:hypothetical protein